MIEKIVQGLGEVLKGLVQITIRKINMFNTYNSVSYVIEKVDTLIIADKETAEKMVEALKQRPVEVKELTVTQEPEQS